MHINIPPICYYILFNLRENMQKEQKETGSKCIILFEFVPFALFSLLFIFYLSANKVVVTVIPSVEAIILISCPESFLNFKS